MKISIMCSLLFTKEVGEIKKKLEEAGHEVSVPYSVARILNGEVTFEEIEQMKKDGSINDYARERDLIRWNYERMKGDDAILVVNIEKNGQANYIGGNTFLEIGFAHVLGMKIFLWNDIPENKYYKDEIIVMNPKVINQDILLIK